MGASKVRLSIMNYPQRVFVRSYVVSGVVTAHDDITVEYVNSVLTVRIQHSSGTMREYTSRASIEDTCSLLIAASMSPIYEI